MAGETSRKKSQQSGLIKLILLIIIGIAILSYFRVDLRSLFESGQAQANFAYVWGAIKSLWQSYLIDPVLTWWHKVVEIDKLPLILSYIDK